MIKTLIINLIIIALLTYGVLIFLHFRAYEKKIKDKEENARRASTDKIHHTAA